MSRLFQNEQLLALDVLAVPDGPLGRRLGLGAVARDPAIFVALPAPLEIAEEELQRAEVRAPFRKVRLQGERVFEVFFGVVETSKVLPRQASPAIGLRRRRIGKERALEPVERQFDLVALEVDDAAAEQRLDASRLLHERRVEHRGGLREAPHFPKRRAPVAEDAHMLWILSERRVEDAERFREAARVIQDVAAKEQGLEFGRRQVQELFAKRKRFIEAAKLMQRHGRAVESLTVGRGERERVREALIGLSLIARGRMDDAAVVPCGRVSGVGGDEGLKLR